MKAFQTHAEIGPDRVLRLTLPEDAPTGDVEILLVLERANSAVDLEARRKAAEAGRGALAGVGLSTEEFHKERHAS